jgi:sulfate permease, SulP family
LRNREEILGDVKSAVTVAIVGLPQCLAYALVAGLPPAYGLATAALPGFIAAIAGRSNQLITGPTNTTGILVLAALTPYLGADGLLPAEGLAILATLTLMAGLLRLALAGMGGATLLRFLPESVIIGFTAGAGLLIVVMQLDEAMGLTRVRAGSLSQEFESMHTVLAAGQSISWAAVALAFVTAGLIVGGQRASTRIPVALITVLAGTVLAWWFGWNQEMGLGIIGERSSITPGWPLGALPLLDATLFLDLLPAATAIALIGTMELAVSAKANGATPDMRREIFAQGWANIAGSVGSCFPASASLTRSALLVQSGGRTRAAAIVSAIVIVPIVFSAGLIIEKIPQASLAGVLFATAYGMLDWRRIRRMWSVAHKTRVLLITTFVSTLVFPLQWGMLVGVMLGIFFHLRETIEPRFRFYTVPETNPFAPLQRWSDTATSSTIFLVEISGDLHYAAADELATLVDRIPPQATCVILDLTHAHAMRFAALEAFEKIETTLPETTFFALSGVAEPFAKKLANSKSTLQWFPTEYEPQRSVRSAIEFFLQRTESGESDQRA